MADQISDILGSIKRQLSTFDESHRRAVAATNSVSTLKAADDARTTGRALKSGLEKLNELESKTDQSSYPTMIIL